VKGSADDSVQQAECSWQHDHGILLAAGTATELPVANQYSRMVLISRARLHWHARPVRLCVCWRRLAPCSDSGRLAGVGIKLGRNMCLTGRAGIVHWVPRVLRLQWVYHCEGR
jgi:hypothetical protein